MGKKYRIIILAFMMVFALAACKGKESTKQVESETTSKDVVSEETSPKKNDSEEIDSEEDVEENVSKEEENIIQDTWSESSKENTTDKNEITTPSNDSVEETQTPESPNNPETPNTDSSTDDSDKDYQYEDDKGWLPWV